MVWTGDTNINIWLIRNGWSFYLLENEPPLEHKDLLSAENEAKQLKVGLWKAELQ
jgi:endonuclease YncB( thermonuclease family)